MLDLRPESLAFVHFRAPDLDAMASFGADFGLAEAGRTDEALYLRGHSSAPYLHVTTRGEPGFVGLAFAATGLDLRAFARDRGLPLEPLARPGGGIGTQLVDPDGFVVELVAEQEVRQDSGLPPRAATNDVRTRLRQAPKRLPEGPAHIVRIGHCVLAVSDFRKSERWYKERFGLLTSDEIVDEEGLFGPKGSTVGAFLRLDQGATPTDHHTVFLLGTGKAGFHHAAFEVLDLDDLMSGHSHLKTRSRAPEWGIGRHLLGSQVFDYWRDPWGHTVEHWTDGDFLDRAWGSRQATVKEALHVQWGPVFPGMKP